MCDSRIPCMCLEVSAITKETEETFQLGVKDVNMFYSDPPEKHFHKVCNQADNDDTLKLALDDALKLALDVWSCSRERGCCHGDIPCRVCIYDIPKQSDECQTDPRVQIEDAKRQHGTINILFVDQQGNQISFTWK